MTKQARVKVSILTLMFFHYVIGFLVNGVVGVTLGQIVHSTFFFLQGVVIAGGIGLLLLIPFVAVEVCLLFLMGKKGSLAATYIYSGLKILTGLVLLFLAFSLLDRAGVLAVLVRCSSAALSLSLGICCLWHRETFVRNTPDSSFTSKIR